ncbi:Thioredoxin [Desulfosarcina cetonica]|uniref:thioredoxin family protein n=1 Tax=Desulfosarcina cetonica TaxID=90730 RepID=UPI0006D2C577|nr:thioredoxin domain-containing protein [Desulfosarcina cetonica]VTR69174.1 Thioredoxin [Desulfosarcina cetonica]
MATDHSLERRFKQSVARGVTLVDLGASWCDPCRAQTSIIRELERRFSPAARFKIMDIEKYRDIALQLGIQSIPTIILYKNGREMRRFIGLQTRDTLGRALRLLME